MNQYQKYKETRKAYYKRDYVKEKLRKTKTYNKFVNNINIPLTEIEKKVLIYLKPARVVPIKKVSKEAHNKSFKPLMERIVRRGLVKKIKVDNRRLPRTGIRRFDNDIRRDNLTCVQLTQEGIKMRDNLIKPVQILPLMNKDKLLISLKPHNTTLYDINKSFKTMSIGSIIKELKEEGLVEKELINNVKINKGNRLYPVSRKKVTCYKLTPKGVQKKHTLQQSLNMN